MTRSLALVPGDWLIKVFLPDKADAGTDGVADVAESATADGIVAVHKSRAHLPANIEGASISRLVRTRVQGVVLEQAVTLGPVRAII